MTIKTPKAFDRILGASSKTKSLVKVLATIQSELAGSVKTDSMAVVLTGDSAPFVIFKKSARTKARKEWIDSGAFEQSHLSKVIENSKPAWKKAGNDPFLGKFLGSKDAATGLVPLVSQGRTIGVLGVGRKNGRAFSAEDKKTLKSLAALISPIIHLHRFSSSQLDFSFTDSLTGLRNYHFLQLRLEEEINRVDRYKGSFSILLVDIDKFRAFNDKWGYRIGTGALVQVARIIAENLRQVDMACRFGTDAFAVVLTRTSLEQAQLTADRIRAKIARTNFTKSPKKAKLTVSTGIAVYPEDSSMQSGILEAAEMALARAKSKGCNRSTSFSTMLAE